jgi:HK97 family phage portal protein
MSLKDKWRSLFSPKVEIVQEFVPKVNNNKVVWVEDNLGSYLKEGFAANDIIYSIGQITSEKIKVAPWHAYKIKDETAYKKLRALEKSKPEHIKTKDLQELKTKALEHYTADGKLTELLKYPNEEESFQDLVAHNCLAKMMTGNGWLRAMLLNAGGNTGKPYELYNLPPQFMQIVHNGEFPMRVVGYKFNIDSQPIPLSRAEVMHVKYSNPLYSKEGGHLYGLAPLRAARYTLSNENASLEASTKSFQNMGPGGALFVDDARITAAQAEAQGKAVKSQMMEEYTGTGASKKIVVSGYKLGYAEMGLSPVDLAIIQQQKWNLVRLANVWNFPHLLLLSDHATDNNAGWAEKSLTSRCAMPLMTAFRDNFNRQLNDFWGYKDKGVVIDYDQSVYPELGDDLKELTDWIDKSWEIPLKMRYELKGLDIPDYIDPQDLEKIFVPNGYRTLQDALAESLDIEINRD